MDNSSPSVSRQDDNSPPGELVENIHVLNERNHRVLTPSSPARRPADVNSGEGNEVSLLDQIQSRIAGQLRTRVDRAIERFGEKLEALGREQPTAGDDPLLKTQEIEYPRSANPEIQLASRDLARLRESIVALERTISDEEDTRREALVDRLSEVLDARLAERKTTPDEASTDPPREWQEATRDIRGRIETLAESIGKLHPDGAATAPSLDTTEFTATLLERFADLEATLSENWESCVERLLPEGRPFPSEALEQALSTLQANAGGTAARPAAEPGAAADVAPLVMGLKKEFSLLVHTINGHLEETRKLSDDVTRSVRETIESLGGRPDAAREADLVGKLEQSLAQFRELNTLPDKITAILTAADAVNQQNLSQAIERATQQLAQHIAELKPPSAPHEVSG